ncbi:MAG: ParB/RepB/Spo0J family partition protein [Desulfohalobiaceae bacterium]|nr:ParB/RepB/Spo0J family partition protein [Desulfohalobiaceae bacterium]
MPPSNKGLGRGLDALFQQNETSFSDEAGSGYQFLQLDCLDPNPNQPRKTFSTESLQELAESIRKQGLLQPLLVRPSHRTPGRYEIIAGERRWRACHLAQLEQLPVIVSDISDTDAMILGLMENLQREDLNPVEEAEGLRRLQELAGMGQEELAQRVGKSRSGTANSLRLLKLEPEILEAVREQRIGASQARNLLAIDDADIRWQVFQLLLQNRLTIRDLENLITYYREEGKLPDYLSQQPSENRKTSSDSGFKGLKKRLQQQMSHYFDTPVRIRGSQDKGSVSFSYNSRQELSELLQKFGLQEDDNVSRET